LLTLFAVAAIGLGGGAIVSCAHLTGQTKYVDPSMLVLERVLPPPPSDGSPAERAELDEMLRIQGARTPAQAERAKEDATISVFRLGDALGSPAEFNKTRLPHVAALFDKVREAEWAVIGPAKKSFDRKRPYVMEPQLKPVISRLDSQAYPSGHATWAFAVGFVLADMVPEKRAEILTRAAEFAHNRTVAGVHYPSDVDAGRICGSVLAAFLFASPEFRGEEQQAAAELRSALKLPTLH
jgi:acid phosphatase (class A)